MMINPKSSTTLLVLLLLVLYSALPAFAQTCSNTSIPFSNPTSRFILDNASGTATDTATGLIWKRCSEGQAWSGSTCTGTSTPQTWQAALTTGDTATFAGMNDWRLPNRNELASIIEYQCVSPAINLTIFPLTPAAVYWSSSPFVDGDPAHAWIVDFLSGYSSSDFKQFTREVRLVRGGE